MENGWRKMIEKEMEYSERGDGNDTLITLQFEACGRTNMRKQSESVSDPTPV